MHGIEFLYWALSILFCLAMVFAILLWCRSWRREERGETERQILTLSREVSRLIGTVDMLEHTSASLQTADEQLAQDVESLRKSIHQIRASVSPVKAAPQPGETQTVRPVAPPAPQAAPDLTAEETETDRYAQARALLAEGRSAQDVARTLDIGTAEVRMIARMVNTEKDREKAHETTEGERGA